MLCDKLSRFRGPFCIHLRRVFTLQMEAQTSDMRHNLCISYRGNYFAVWRKSSSSYTPFLSSEQSELRSVRYQWTRHVTVTVSSNVGLRFSSITLTSCAKYTCVWVVELIRNMAWWNVTFLLLAKILNPSFVSSSLVFQNRHHKGKLMQIVLLHRVEQWQCIGYGGVFATSLNHRTI